MRIKLDENIGLRGAEIFRKQGHDVATVSGQGMQSASDQDLIAACAAEKRCLVTLDLDFSQPFAFPPERYAGIAVLRLPSRSLPSDLSDLMRTLSDVLTERNIAGRLWIVQRSGVREYRPAAQDV